MRDLEAILRRIDGRGYKAYKDLQGKTFLFGEFRLVIDHVQGDPYAAPSRARAVVSLETSQIPASATASPARCRATRDFMARTFRRAAHSERALAIDAGGQTVLDRTACLIGETTLELRFTVDLPGAGRRILGRQAWDILSRVLPEAVIQSTLARNLDLRALERHCATVEDQDALRGSLATAGLVAFVGNGAALPRRSGVEQIEDPSQVRTIGWILGRLSEWREASMEPLPVVRDMITRLEDGDWDWLTGRHDGDLALPRPHEVLAALNRLRGAEFNRASGNAG